MVCNGTKLKRKCLKGKWQHAATAGQQRLCQQAARSRYQAASRKQHQSAGSSRQQVGQWQQAAGSIIKISIIIISVIHY